MDAVSELIDRASALIDRYGLNPIHMGFVMVLRAMLLIQQGRAQEAIAIGQLLAGAPKEILRLVPYVILPLAAAYAGAGQAEAALSSVNNVIALLSVSETRVWDAETHRARGEILLIQPAPDLPEAEQCFRTAIAIARRQSAKSWELRATTSLARLLGKQGRRDEGRQMLGEIYGWFSEGFDTADLKEAKAFLAELNRQ
jgi:predicted ATPase